MRHIITVTPRIAGALVSTFPFTFPRITTIGTADPDIFITSITAGIVISKVARSLALGTSGQTSNPAALDLVVTEDAFFSSSGPRRSRGSRFGR